MGGRARGRYDADIGISHAQTVSRSRRPGAGTQGRSLSPRDSAAGRRLAHLLRRSLRDQRIGKGLFCAETQRNLGRRAPYGARARLHPRQGRGRSGERVHENCAGAVRSVRLGRHSAYAGRADAAPEVVLFQYLRYLLLVPRGVDPAADRVRASPGLSHSASPGN